LAAMAADCSRIYAPKGGFIFDDAGIGELEEQIKEAKSLYYPRLNLSAGYTHFNEPVTIDVDINISKVAGPFNLAIPQVVQFGIVLDPIPNALHQEFTLGETEWAALSLNLIQPLYTFGRIKEAVKQPGSATRLRKARETKRESKLSRK
ncbi:MAG: hypothetical protein EHM36_03730, partial [Deltaproteobacteria bacterium]